MSKKDLESMSIEELAAEVSETYKKLNYNPKKIKVDENGNVLLDWNDKNDREWYENDEEYDGIINIKDYGSD